MKTDIIKTALKQFKDLKVVVIGDLILDHYIIGDIERISPEAPVPILREASNTHKMGGAANVAANAASLGADVTLIGAVGDDLDATLLTSLCMGHGIEPAFVRHFKRTICKTRVIAQKQQMIRLDREDKYEVSEIAILLQSKIQTIVPEADVVIISDYMKGVITAEVMEQIKSYEKPIVVDPKPAHLHLYKGVTLITPNLLEIGEKFETGGYIRAAESLHGMLEAYVVVTLGSNGLFLCTPKGTHYKAVAKEVFDVTGAGDTVVAVLALCVGSNFGLQEACQLANIAAGITVSHLGTASVTPEELLAEGE